MKQFITIAVVALLSVSAHKLDAKPKVVPSDFEKALSKFESRQEEVKEKLDECIKETKPKEGVDPENTCRPERAGVDPIHNELWASVNHWLEVADRLGFNKHDAKPPKDLKNWDQQFKELEALKKTLDAQVKLETEAYKKPLEDEKKLVETIDKKIKEAGEIKAEHAKKIEAADE